MAANNSSNKVNGTSRKPVKLVGAVVLVAVVVLAVIWLKAVRAQDDTESTMATFVAQKGPLTISVLESGAIKAREQEVIRNEVEGRTTIISIVPEGSRVHKGDLLVELDASTLTDTQIDQEIKVQNAEAAYINAVEALAIAENQAKSDIELADLTLKFAKQDLKKYEEKQYKNLEVAAVSKVQEANEVLIRAVQTLEWSDKLYQEKYLSKTEFLADQLAVTKGTNSLTVAQNDLELLQQYTKPREVDKLVSDVNQAEMALERTKRKASANVVQAKAELNAKEQEHKRQISKLDKLKDQITKATVYSPADGMVVYATSSRGGFGRDDRKPLADGVEVWERQELIYIPKSASSVAEVDVHEASLDKVRPGLPAIVKVDALPGKEFIGTVERIAPLPNAQSMWMNPDLKVYTTNINLDTSDESLRSGMSCKADIIVEQYASVVYVPVQSVLRVGGEPTIYVVKEGLIEERKVKTGLDNNSMIAILGGLEAGEVVLMTPPLKEAALEPGERVPGSGDANDPRTQRINEKLKAANELSSRPATMPRQDMQAPAGAPGQQGGMPGAGQGFPQMTDEQRQQFQKFQNATPEERQKMAEEFQKNMTPEQREQAQQARQRMQNMSPEERQKMMEERMKNMTPEQRQQMEERRQRRGNRGQEGDAGPGGPGGSGFGGRGGEGGGRQRETGGGQPQGGQ
ncbi:MAG: efflux RND transporter periplasmic adaptor subunit [Phycisphaerales bacterium]